MLQGKPANLVGVGFGDKLMLCGTPNRNSVTLMSSMRLMGREPNLRVVQEHQSAPRSQNQRSSKTGSPSDMLLLHCTLKLILMEYPGAAPLKQPP